MDKADQSRVDSKKGKKTKKKTTADWDLEVECVDGSSSWLPLKEPKETNTVNVAQYAIDNCID